MLRLRPRLGRLAFGAVITTAFGAMSMSACVSIPYDPGPEDRPGIDVPAAEINVGPFFKVDPGDVLEFALDELDNETPMAVWSVGDAALHFEELIVDPPVALAGDLPPLDLEIETGAQLEADFASAGAGDYALRVVTDDYDRPEVALTVRVVD